MDTRILSRRALKKKLECDHARKKIVFTNGCFDLLHAGHISVFEKARALGDVLVVGLNSDASVRRLKGKTRPLVSEKYRARVISALRAVDYVTIFDEETPEKLIRFLRPDILVKGGDYKTQEIVGRQWVKKVVRIKLVDGLSTTQLVEKIRKQ